MISILTVYKFWGLSSPTAHSKSTIILLRHFNLPNLRWKWIGNIAKLQIPQLLYGNKTTAQIGYLHNMQKIHSYLAVIIPTKMENTLDLILTNNIV